MSSISIIPDAAAEFDSLRKEPAEAMLKSLSAPAPPATVAGTRQSRPSAPNSDSEKKIDLPAIRAHPTPPRISEPVCETSQLPSSSRGREAVPTTTPAKYVELSAAETQPNAASGSKSDEAAAAAIHAAAVPTTPAGVAATSAAVAAAESKSHEAAVPPPSKSHEAAAAESKSHEAAVPPPSKSHEAAAAESKSHEATVPPPSKSHEAAAAESTSETASAPASGAAAVATRTMLPEASTAEELDASTPSAKAHVSPVTPDAAADAVPNMETQGKEANSSEQQPEEERESQKHLSMQDPLSLQRGFSHFMNLPKLHERNKGERGADDGTRRRSGSVVGEGEADSRYRPSSNGSTDTERKQEEGDATKRLADGLEDVVEYIQSDAEKVELVRPPEYSGFLWKKSPVALVGWQLRWFVLKDRRLLYYKQKGDVRPLGRLDLELIRIKVQVDLLDLLCCGGRLGSKAALSAGEEQPTRLRFRIKPLGSKRIFELAGHVNEVIEWIDNLRESYRGSHMKESSAAALVAGQKLFWKIERVSPSVFQDVSSTGDILLFRNAPYVRETGVKGGDTSGLFGGRDYYAAALECSWAEQVYRIKDLG
ncbi:ph domain [Cyclospora cayetanensis]|uniref:Ph domain n=1 Tax=Cyclospora cayetanensis TaxID=88456 RepID=A0A1D3D6Q5_9EIME|nr:ph domain [Cyclospora cayetanensis]